MVQVFVKSLNTFTVKYYHFILSGHERGQVLHCMLPQTLCPQLTSLVLLMTKNWPSQFWKILLIVTCIKKNSNGHF